MISCSASNLLRPKETTKALGHEGSTWSFDIEEPDGFVDRMNRVKLAAVNAVEADHIWNWSHDIGGSPFPSCSARKSMRFIVGGTRSQVCDGGCEPARDDMYVLSRSLEARNRFCSTGRILVFGSARQSQHD
ncbi:hypothetical protein BDZ89DRAFT_490004 [Hymenopellis radicata]|nr:hypothetical protein BDZ89DRAFT_490004 [Hymenopellis radicata]